jgi:hypothetical protein
MEKYRGSTVLHTVKKVHQNSGVDGGGEEPKVVETGKFRQP